MLAKFDTYQAYRDALLDLLKNAQGTLWLYEHDFRESGLNHREASAALGLLLARNPAAQVRILAHTSEFLATQCPLLLELANRHNPKIQIRLSNPDMPPLFSPFILADMQRFVRRCHFDWPKGDYDDDAREVGRMRQAFDMAWECAAPSTDLRRLDL